jgi:murein DD-endopeptidase MepM/ murein hydrolase activator NlpD
MVTVLLRVAALALVGLLPAASVTPAWQWPLAPPRTIVRPYLAPQATYTAGHRGIDIAAVEGSPVLAPADGTVHFAGTVVDRPVLSIDQAGGLLSSFEPVQTTLVEGQAVRRGDQVGIVATGGHCSELVAAVSCLHFGVRLNGEYVSPLNYLGGIPRSVLLPMQ